VSNEPTALSVHCKLVKDLENDLSQLNRLGVAYSHLVYFRFQPRVLHRLFVGAQSSVLLLSHSVSNDFQTTLLIPVQFRTGNWQLRTDNCFCTE